jgi:hypothetical protein
MQVGTPTRKQYRKLVDAFAKDRLDFQGAADAAGVHVTTARKAYDGSFAASSPWCVSIRDFLDGKVDIDLDIYNGKSASRSHMKERGSQSAPTASALELPEVVDAVLARLGAPVEDKAGREQDHRTILAITRRITGLRLGSVAESTMRMGKLLDLLHKRTEEVLSGPLDAEGLVMTSQAALNIGRLHQAMTAQVVEIIKAERELNPRDETGDAIEPVTPTEGEQKAAEALNRWGHLLARKARGAPTGP